MSIPQTNPSHVPDLIFYLGSKISGVGVTTALTSLEAAFYGTLQGGVKDSNRLVKWLRETSIERIHAVQMIFNAVNAGIILYFAKRLFDEVQNGYVFTAALASVTLSVYVFNRFLQPQLKSEREEKGVKIAEKLSTQQKIAKVLHVTKIVLNVALACFAKDRFFLTVSLLESSYCLIKNLKLKWITFSREFPFISTNPDVPITQVKATYHMLALPVSTAIAQEECSICLEQQTDMVFCANHVFHQACMAQTCIEKSESFINGSQFTKRTIDHYTNGSYTGTTHKYSISLPEDSLPSCPMCREKPLQNDCEIRVTDSAHGVFNAAVTIGRRPTDRQYLFENLYAIYNVAQAGLTHLQKYPELAGAIYTIQKVMLITDVIGYGFTVYYLYGKVIKKFELENSIRCKIVAAIIFVAAAALSCIAVVQINSYLRPALILKDVLAQLPIAPEILKTLDISWGSPSFFQFVHLNRMIASIALAFFSEQRKTSMLNIAAQIFNLVGISNLKWITLIQNLDSPALKNIAPSSLKSLKTTYHYLVDSSCATDSSNLKSTLQSIYDRTSTFFDKSTWSRYWRVTKNQYGVEVGRTLCYDVTLQNVPNPSTLPNLLDYSISAIDATYGSATVHVR